MATACEENKGKIRSGAEIKGTSNRNQVDNLEEKNNTLYVCSFDRGRWKWVPLKKISQKNYKLLKNEIIETCISNYRLEDRAPLCHPIKLTGATGSNAEQINGVFYPQPNEVYSDGHMVYLRDDNNTHKRWIYFVPTRSKWRLGNTRYKDDRKAVGWLQNMNLDNSVAPSDADPWAIDQCNWRIWDGTDSAGNWIVCPNFKIELMNDGRAREIEEHNKSLQLAHVVQDYYKQLNDKYRAVSAILFNKMSKEDKIEIINSVEDLKTIFKKENICGSCFSCKKTTPCVHFDCPGACAECREKLDENDKCCTCGKSQKMQCPICFETFTPDQLEIFKCRHCVCLRCYLQSYKINKKLKKCPTCRAALPKNHIVV